MSIPSQTIQDFVYQELSKPHFEYSIEVNSAYQAVVQWLSNRYMIGFNAKKGGGQPNLDRTGDFSKDRHDTGQEFTFLFPSHCMKVYQTYLQIEYRLAQNEKNAIIGKSVLTIIDVGCGGGAASIGLIALLTNYQKYRRENRLPLTPITLNFLGIDPNFHALQIYAEFLTECASRVKDLLIKINDIKLLPGTLPENSSETLQWISNQKRIHCVIFALSNIIRPLTQIRDHDNKTRSLFDQLGSARFLLPINRGHDIASKELVTLKAILEQGDIDQIVVPLISADSGNKNWHTEMQDFLNTLRSQFARLHEVHLSTIQRNQFSFINPPGSYHRDYKNYTDPVPISYNSGFAIILNNKYIEDTNWQNILDQNNLLLAWARVRNSFAYDAIEDTIEIRLFEYNIEARLKRLREEVISYHWDALNVPEMFNFLVPKGHEKHPRPMSLCRIEDAILATAILQVKLKEYNKIHFSNSYAYKLSWKHGEFLYDSWFKQYKLFLLDARSIAANNSSYHILQTDLSSYYTNINQALLFRDTEQLLALYKSRCSDLAEQIVYRDCNLGKDKTGIPQGHIISGALSNIYLSQVDSVFINKPHGIHYFRFVDDIILIYPSNLPRQFVLDLLDYELLKRELSRSEGKTSEVMTVEDFLKLTEFDEELEILSQEHAQLTSVLYKLDRNYIKVAVADWWIFVENYQNLLMNIGVYVSIPRLSRKLQKNLRWWQSHLGWFSKFALPPVDHMDDLRDAINWQFEFYRLHGKPEIGWLDKKEHIRSRLAQLLRNNLPLLESTSTVDQKKAKSRVKFAIQRLGQLGFEEEATIIAEILLTQPWYLNPRRVCHDLALQGYQNLLVDVFNQLKEYSGIEWSYVRGAVLKSFSNLPSPSNSVIKILCDVLLGSSSNLEKLMASETLLLIQKTEQLSKQDLEDAIRKCDDSYLVKNNLLLHALVAGKEESGRADLDNTGIYNDTIEYIRTKENFDDLYRHEPEILRQQFYDGVYADSFEEFEDFPYITF